MKLERNENTMIHFTMRMNQDVYEKLKETAKNERRSIAKQLEHITVKFFEQN